jgi:hypothetical protein
LGCELKIPQVQQAVDIQRKVLFLGWKLKNPILSKTDAKKCLVRRRVGLSVGCLLCRLSVVSVLLWCWAGSATLLRGGCQRRSSAWGTSSRDSPQPVVAQHQQPYHESLPLSLQSCHQERSSRRRNEHEPAEQHRLRQPNHTDSQHQQPRTPPPPQVPDP